MLMRSPVRAKPRTADAKTFRAPVKGWIANANLASNVPDAAHLLENWLPTATGIRIRGGASKHATIGVFELTELTGTVAIDGTTTVTGTGTDFQSELEVGDTVSIDGHLYEVDTITNDTELDVTENTHGTLTGLEIFLQAEELTAQEIEALFSYINGNNEKLFAATEESITDVTTPASAAVPPDPAVTDLTSGDWITVQFATSGGVFLLCVNGADKMQRFDGTSWLPVIGTVVNELDYDGGTAAFSVGETLTGGTSGATAPILRVTGDSISGTLLIGAVTNGPFQNDEAITSAGGAAVADGVITEVGAALTGIDTDDISYIWSYRSRIWMVEKDSLSAWYLAVDSIAGAATELPLGGIFPKGGSLLFGASWSIDDTSGLAAYNIFVSTEGEVAVYRGSNPGDADDWSLVGVYQIGRPLGKRAWIRGGGDIIVATDIGFVPLSQAVSRDLAALAPVAVSYPIETAWNERVLRRTGDWQCKIWPTGQSVFVAPSRTSSQRTETLVANARTGAWTLYTGWDISAMDVFRDRFYFGNPDGIVARGEASGADLGTPFTATCVLRFDDCKAPAAIKTATLARASILASQEMHPEVFMQQDFRIDLPAAPDAVVLESSGDLWGTGLWGAAMWSESSAPVKYPFEEWRSVYAAGYTIAPGVMLTSGGTNALDAELVRVDVMYERGDFVS